MIYCLISGGILLLFVAGWYLTGRKGFRQALGRIAEIPLDTISLEKTHYAPYASRLRDGISAYRSLPWRECSLTASDGVLLKARYCSQGANRTVILIHGYHAVPENNFPTLASALFSAGYDLFVPFLRAHGDSGGDYCTFGPQERDDLFCWLKKLQQESPEQELFLYGVSMGAHIAALCGPDLGRYPVRAMVLDCGFVNEYREIRHRTPPLFPPFRSFVVFSIYAYAKLFHGFDLKRGDAIIPLSHTTTPVFVIHGTADTIVPFSENAPQLLAAAGGVKRFRYLEGAEHNECMLAGGPELEREILDFFQTCSQNNSH